MQICLCLQQPHVTVRRVSTGGITHCSALGTSAMAAATQPQEQQSVPCAMCSMQPGNPWVPCAALYACCREEASGPARKLLQKGNGTYFIVSDSNQRFQFTGPANIQVNIWVATDDSRESSGALHWIGPCLQHCAGEVFQLCTACFVLQS